MESVSSFVGVERSVIGCLESPGRRSLSVPVCALYAWGHLSVCVWVCVCVCVCVREIDCVHRGEGHELTQTKRCWIILFRRLPVLVIHTFSTCCSCTSGPTGCSSDRHTDNRLPLSPGRCRLGAITCTVISERDDSSQADAHHSARVRKHLQASETRGRSVPTERDKRKVCTYRKRQEEGLYLQKETRGRSVPTERIWKKSTEVQTLYSSSSSSRDIVTVCRCELVRLNIKTDNTLTFSYYWEVKPKYLSYKCRHLVTVMSRGARVRSAIRGGAGVSRSCRNTPSSHHKPVSDFNPDIHLVFIASNY